MLELQLGDVLRLKKVHPCGGADWQVVRLGADIGLRCLKCGHRVLLSRSDLEKRIKKREIDSPSPSPIKGEGT